MNKYRKRQKLLRQICFAVLLMVAVLLVIPSVGFSLVSLFSPKLALLLFGGTEKGIACASMFLIGRPRVLRKDDDDDGCGGGDGDDDKTFRKKVLAGVTTLREQADELEQKVELLESSQQKILSEPDRWPKHLKELAEGVTRLKNTANDQQANFDKLQQRLALFDAMIQREARFAFRDPIDRIIANEELRARFNIAMRLAVNNEGDDMMRVVKNGFDKELVKKALGEDTSPGSTLINNQLAAEIYDTLAQFGSWNTLGVRRLGTKITTYPVKTVRPIALVILTEAGELADDGNKAGTSVDLEVEVIAALLNVSLQLIQDSEFDVTMDVLDDFREAYNFRLDHLAFAADGTADSTHGGMTGLFNFATAAPAAAGNTSIEATQLEDWVRCLTTVDVGVLARPCAWWMHPHNLARAILVRDDNGRSIFQTAIEAPSPGAIGSILGFPVNRVPAAPSANVASSKVAVFGDRQAMVVGTRQDFTFEGSDHHKWNTLQRSFRGYGRAGTKGRRAQGAAALTNAAA